MLTGTDEQNVLGMSQADLKDLLGPARGIALYNKLHPLVAAAGASSTLYSVFGVRAHYHLHDRVFIQALQGHPDPRSGYDPEVGRLVRS